MTERSRTLRVLLFDGDGFVRRMVARRVRMTGSDCREIEDKSRLGPEIAA